MTIRLVQWFVVSVISDEIKSAYRQKALKCHPDKVSLYTAIICGEPVLKQSLDLTKHMIYNYDAQII